MNREKSIKKLYIYEIICLIVGTIGVLFINYLVTELCNIQIVNREHIAPYIGLAGIAEGLLKAKVWFILLYTIEAVCIGRAIIKSSFYKFVKIFSCILIAVHGTCLFNMFWIFYTKNSIFGYLIVFINIILGIMQGNILLQFDSLKFSDKDNNNSNDNTKTKNSNSNINKVKDKIIEKTKEIENKEEKPIKISLTKLILITLLLIAVLVGVVLAVINMYTK